jgi:rhodanese-related sulfurtransferase
MSDSISTDEFNQLRERHPDVTLLDVRREGDFEADRCIIPGAIRRPPESVESWASDLPADAPILVYCVLGGSVSQSVARVLRQKGLNAKYISGGIKAWKVGGGEVEPVNEHSD